MPAKAIFFQRELNGEQRDFCRISVQGIRDVWEGPVRPQDLSRFPDEWDEFKKQQKKPKKKGGNLNDLPGMSEPRRVELELVDIETIEELAAADEVLLRNMGDPYVQLKKIAGLHIDAKPKRSRKPAAEPVEEPADEPADDSPDDS